MDYSFLLAARVLLYSSSYIQNNTYHRLYYTSCGALAATRNSPIRRTNRTMSEHSYHRATSRTHRKQSNGYTPVNRHTRKEGNILFNNTLNTFYLRLYDVGQTHQDKRVMVTYVLCRFRCKQTYMFYLMLHSTHFIYGIMASDRHTKTESDGDTPVLCQFSCKQINKNKVMVTHLSFVNLAVNK